MNSCSQAGDGGGGVMGKQLFSTVQTQQPVSPWLLPGAAENRPGICVVIPAKNEAAVIAETLDWLGGFLGPEDRVHVVADGCTDATARTAWKHGAITHVRGADSRQGKGAALSWWLQQTHGCAPWDEPVLILDADSRISPDLVEQVRSSVQAGMQVLQVRIAPMVGSRSPVAMLAAFSEVVEHRVKDPLRARLGWPVRLRGTGMVLPRGLLEELSARVETFVEDIELTLLLAERGISIGHLESPYVADPKPEQPSAASRQRARWFRGQLQVLRVHWKAVLGILRRGPGGWFLLASIFLKPAVLFLSLRLLFFLLFLSSVLQEPSFSAGLAAGLLGGSLLLDGWFCLQGLRYVPDRGGMLRALLRSPLFLLMWLQSVLLSLIGGETWHQVRTSDS